MDPGLVFPNLILASFFLLNDSAKNVYINDTNLRFPMILIYILRVMTLMFKIQLIIFYAM